MIRAINAAKRPVLALDIPSGVNADSGAVHEAAVRAEVTVSFVGAQVRAVPRRRARTCGRGAARRSRRGGARAAAIRAAHAAHRRERARREPAAPRARVAQGHERPRADHRRRRRHAGRAAAGGRGGAARGRGAGHGRGRAGEPASPSRPRVPSSSIYRLRRSRAWTSRCAAADVLAIGPGLGTGDWARRLWARPRCRRACPRWSMPMR